MDEASALDIKKALECPVCFDEFDAKERCPRMLACAHTICGECVGSLAQGAAYAFAFAYSIVCPVCRKPTQFTEALPLNFALCAIVDKCKASVGQTKPSALLVRVCASRGLSHLFVVSQELAVEFARHVSESERVASIAGRFHKLVLASQSESKEQRVSALPRAFLDAIKTPCARSVAPLLDFSSHWRPIVRSSFSDHPELVNALIAAQRSLFERECRQLVSACDEVLQPPVGLFAQMFFELAANSVRGRTADEREFVYDFARLCAGVRFGFCFGVVNNVCFDSGCYEPD